MWWLTLLTPAFGQTIADRAVHVEAHVVEDGMEISWNRPGSTTAVAIDVREVGEVAWTSIATPSSSASKWVDTALPEGGMREYRVRRNAGHGWAYGYVRAARNRAAVLNRGAVLLVVDDTHAVALADELDRLEIDLIGDGWRVVREDIPRTWSDIDVKDLIVATRNALPALRSVYLLGHVAVPHSGNRAWDGHSDHAVAWAADTYYADLDVWTDTSGNGNWDHNFLPSDVELEVGRVDFHDLPAFSESETELLRRYLDKAHAWRHGEVTPNRGVLIDDHFGSYTGNYFATPGYLLAPLVGRANIAEQDWVTHLHGTENTYLFAIGAGGGWHTSADGVINTSQAAANEQRAVFTALLGSYFGNWDRQNNLMRAQLASRGTVLSCAWSGRPWWYFYAMGAGATLGEATRYSMNKSEWAGPFSDTTWPQVPRGTHMGLMGDPTLRAFPVPPLEDVSVSITDDRVFASWTLPADVDRAVILSGPTLDGPWFVDEIVEGTSVEYTLPSGEWVIQVKALKQVRTPSGTYDDTSQAVFATVTSVGLEGETDPRSDSDADTDADADADSDADADADSDADTDSDSDADTDDRPRAEGGCGCQSAVSPIAWVGLLPVALLIWRRRRRGAYP